MSQILNTAYRLVDEGGGALEKVLALTHHQLGQVLVLIQKLFLPVFATLRGGAGGVGTFRRILTAGTVVGSALWMKAGVRLRKSLPWPATSWVRYWRSAGLSRGSWQYLPPSKKPCQLLYKTAYKSTRIFGKYVLV
jgi:hypothetical protein